MSHRPLVSQLRLFPLCYLENPSERQAEKNFRNLGFRAEVCMLITLSRLKLKKINSKESSSPSTDNGS